MAQHSETSIESIRNSIQILLSMCDSRLELTSETFFSDYAREIDTYISVSYTHLTLPTIYSV